MIGESTNVTAAWEKRAGWLAHWTWDRLLNRLDLWAKFLPKDKHRHAAGQKPKICRLAPVSAKRGKLKLTERILERHYRGADPGHIIGIQSASLENTSRWIAIDLESTAHREVPLNNLRAATHWREELMLLGFRPLMIETDGAGGYQLLTLFREPLATARAHDFVARLVSDFAETGLESPPRVLPGSPTCDDNDWLRLPGRHPITNHWSRVWNGVHWLAGADAVEALLHAHGDAPTLVRKLAATAAVLSGGGNGATPFAAPQSPRPAQTPQPPKHSPQQEEQALCYLLAATRSDDTATAFAAIGAADIDPSAFHDQIHRQIFEALLALSHEQTRITPTLIGQQIPEDQRPAALGIIDRLLVQKAADEAEFETILANLSRQSAQKSPQASGPIVPSNGDSEVDQILQLWPRLSPTVRQALLALAQSVGHG